MLFFQGYRSGRREVQYTSLKTAKFATDTVNGTGDKIKTLEFSVLGYNKEPAAFHGDSGSLVFRMIDETVVGMVIAGWENNDIAYFTRMDDLRRDILETTGGIDMRMYAP